MVSQNFFFQVKIFFWLEVHPKLFFDFLLREIKMITGFYSFINKQNNLKNGTLLQDKKVQNLCEQKMSNKKQESFWLKFRDFFLVAAVKGLENVKKGGFLLY